MNVLAKILPFTLAALALSGCAPLPTESARTPVRWVVVEKRMGEVTPDGQVGQGRVDPSAVVLTMQPLYREDFQWEVTLDPRDYFVEVLEVSPAGQATPGEVVSAKVRVGGAKEDDVYRLVATSSRTDVEILGERDQFVRGRTPALFRFTCTAPGPGGIAVGVERMVTGVRGRP
jgi:hypothetical protein